MGNVNNLATTFAKIIKEDATATKDSTVYGTAVEFNGKMYVKLDGSERMTPIETTTSIKEGDRVTVLIKAHSATVTGNVTDPSTSKSDKKATDDKVKELSGQVSEFGTVVADKVSTEQLQAAEGRITNLEVDNETVKGTLEANEGRFKSIEADNEKINGTLTANEGRFNIIESNMLTAKNANLKYATIKNLEATDATIHNLSADYGDFKQATADDLKARKAEIDDLAANKLNATDAEIKYANIDFTNIGVAAIKQFYSTSGIIKDLVIGDQTVTGEIVGVTIKGDLIEGNTIVADKLVMKGDDGLFYKLNFDAEKGLEGTQTEYNSINGSIITANSITAEKIAVHDLVAFDATIAGFHIKDTAIYSTGKESAASTVRGIYLGKDGQLGFGDGNNYIKFYIDTDGKYKLGISVESLTFATGQSVKGAIDEVDNKVNAIKSIDSTTIGYLVGDSGTNPPTGIWSAGVPVVPNGKYLWCQKITTYNDGTHDYEYSVSRTGDKGEQGIQGLQGLQGKQGEQGVKGTSSYFHIKYSNDGGKTFTANNGETVGIYIGTYVDNIEADSTSISRYTWQQLRGSQGPKGDQGIKGIDGSNGKTSYLHIKYSNDGGKTFTTNNGETVGAYIGTCTDYNSGDPTTVSSYTWAKIKGEQGNTGPTGPQGKQGNTGATGPQGPKGTDGKNGTSTYFHVAYANSVNGKTSFSVSDPSNRAYIGTYVDTNPTDSTDPTKYTWQLVKGAQGTKGDQGIKGTDGTNGKTSYLHIAYANSADGKTGFDVSNSSGKLYIGQYTDFTPTDSTNPAAYSWTKIKGEQGNTGPQGAQGAQGKQGPQGNTGPTGAAGKGVKSTAVTYQASASATSAPTGTWSGSPVTTSAALPYMWTRTIITYTDNTTSTSYSVGCTPEGVSVGGRNLYSGTKNFSGTKWKYKDSYVTDGTYNGFTVWKRTGAWSGSWQYISVEVGDVYTFSAWVKKSSSGPYAGCFLNGSDVTGQVIYSNESQWPVNQWFKLVHTTKITKAGSMHYGVESSNSNAWWICGIKLEKGNKATDWSPAPEDQVYKGDAVNQVNSELKISGNSIALTTGHFTIDAKNMTLDSAGNAVFSGKVKAATIEGGTISGATISGSAGEFTKSFRVNIDNKSTRGTQWFNAGDSQTAMGYTCYNANYLLNSYISIDNYGIMISSAYSDVQVATKAGIPATISLIASNGITLSPGSKYNVSVDGMLDAKFISIDGEIITDFIVEQGFAGNNNHWRYRKWHSGFAECWGTISYSGISCSNGYGNLYYCSNNDALPFTFKSVNNVQGGATGPKGLYYVSPYNITNYAVAFYIASAAKESNVPVTVKLYVTGTWK